MSKIDLHIHSNKSDDGELCAKEIMKICKQQGMKLISITDHNAIGSVHEAMQYTKDIQVLSGIELDCTYEGYNFHMLGYNIDHTQPIFATIEKDILRQEQQAAKEKIYAFQKATGIPLTLDEVLPHSENGVVSGELIAEILLKRADAQTYPCLQPYILGGSKSDMPNVHFYWDYFSKGKVAYIPINYLTLPQAIEIIHATGGQAVLAHPGQNLHGDDTLLSHIIQEGIDGMEAYSSYHSAETAKHYVDIAMHHQLMITCGSDFHGKHKPTIALGDHHAQWGDDAYVQHLKQHKLIHESLVL